MSLWQYTLLQDHLWSVDVTLQFSHDWIKTEVVGLQVIAAVSATKKKGQSHHTSTSFPPEERVHKERAGGKAFSLLWLLFTSQPAFQESNIVVTLTSNYKGKEEIDCSFSAELASYCSLDMLFPSSLVELLWVNTCLSSCLRKLFKCKSQIRGYRELGIKCILASQDTPAYFYMLLCELPSLL